MIATEEEIAHRINDVAAQIASAVNPPTLMVPILVGGFIYAADLARALHKCKLSLPVEPIWLRRHPETNSIFMRMALPRDKVYNQRILLVDGVLDSGDTMARATVHVNDFCAASVVSSVLIDKCLPGAKIKATYPCFTNVPEFIVGYGMDRNGKDRSCPYVYTDIPEDQ